MDLPSIAAIVVAVLGGSGIGSLLAAIVSWKIAMRKLDYELKNLDGSTLLLDAKANKTIGDSWRDFSETLWGRVTELTARLDAMQIERETMRDNYEKRIEQLCTNYESKIQHLEKEVEKLRKEVKRLRNFIVQHGLDPGEGET
jgi:predicted transcriptional regulator